MARRCCCCCRRRRRRSRRQEDSTAAKPDIVYIDTNLGTHLTTLLPASLSATVSDMKRKIELDHLQIGEIEVDELQVKYEGKLYFLADSIPIARAFFECQPTERKSLLITAKHVVRSTKEVVSNVGVATDDDNAAWTDKNGDFVHGIENNRSNIGEMDQSGSAVSKSKVKNSCVQIEEIKTKPDLCIAEQGVILKSSDVDKEGVALASKSGTKKRKSHKSVAVGQNIYAPLIQVTNVDTGAQDANTEVVQEATTENVVAGNGNRKEKKIRKRTLGKKEQSVGVKGSVVPGEGVRNGPNDENAGVDGRLRKKEKRVTKSVQNVEIVEQQAATNRIEEIEKHSLGKSEMRIIDEDDTVSDDSWSAALSDSVSLSF